MIFVSLRIIAYSAILAINLPCRFEISREVHLQVRYKASVTSVLNYVLECNIPKNNAFLTHVKSSATCIHKHEIIPFHKHLP
jgi:TATA-binding protein-associated factor Taf7